MRPQKAIDPEKAEELASRGLTVNQIAHCLGISPRTFYERQKDTPEVAEAIERGRARGIQQVANALFEAATAGNVVAAIFYLKNRGPLEWQDRRDFTVERKAARSVEELSDEELSAIAGEDASPSVVEQPSAIQ